MRIRFTNLLLLCLLQCVDANAQQDRLAPAKQLSKLYFHVITHAGATIGASGRDVQLHGIPGVQYKTWFAGAGAGLDYYQFRGVPVFVSVRKLFQKPISPFFYAEPGWLLPWIKERKWQNRSWYKTTYERGLYCDMGMGWRFQTNKQHAVLLSAGYSLKQLHEITRPNYIPDPPAQTTITKTDYGLQRISIKVGFQF